MFAAANPDREQSATILAANGCGQLELERGALSLDAFAFDFASVAAKAKAMVGALLTLFTRLDLEKS